MPIRLATSEDWESIVRIYNEAIETRISTADTEPVSVSDREDWLEAHSHDRFPIFVMEADMVIKGWCSLSPYRKGRAALEKAAEISYYVSERNRGQGIATALIEYALSDCESLGIESLVAILLESNVPSINLLRKFQFEEWGRLPKIAVIDGNCYDHLYMGRRVSK